LIFIHIVLLKSSLNIELILKILKLKGTIASFYNFTFGINKFIH
jgi:hypothetical protein